MVHGHAALFYRDRKICSVHGELLLVKQVVTYCSYYHDRHCYGEFAGSMAIPRPIAVRRKP